MIQDVLEYVSSFLLATQRRAANQKLVQSRRTYLYYIYDFSGTLDAAEKSLMPIWFHVSSRVPEGRSKKKTSGTAVAAVRQIERE